jgi:oxygen-independent coproporphyrinogen-3 oxidase
MTVGGATKFGVYVHWPYCARICPYCDFNVYKTRAIDEAAWASALAADLTDWAHRTSPRRLTSLYFGGGTPSLAPSRVIERVIETCAALWGFEDGAEITLEANPGDAEQRQYAAFAALGINRLSLGVQALDDAALRFLGRDHSGAEARRAIERGLAVFSRLSFDLIYARPGQTAAAWRIELREALRLGASHVSLYQLTIEPRTAFERAVARGRWAPPADDLAADLFDIAQEETAIAGLPAYEISNHAAPGAESRHNLLYWTYQDYAGVGPGAHGRFWRDGARIATEAPRSPKDYLAGAPRTEEALTPEAVTAERLAMGLRLADGISLDADEFAALAPRAAALAEEGLLRWDGRRLTATPAGRKVLNAVLAAIL